MSERIRSGGTGSGLSGASDQRSLRDALSHREILRAVDAASLEGLHGLIFGRLATDTGLSKGDMQTLFRPGAAPTRHRHTRQVFWEAVGRPRAGAYLGWPSAARDQITSAPSC